MGECLRNEGFTIPEPYEDPGDIDVTDLSIRRIENFGRCAENPTWRLMLLLNCSNAFRLSLKTTPDRDVMSLIATDVASRLRVPCVTCSSLAEQAGSANPAANFGVDWTKEILQSM